jgi:hypothetical protein
METDAKRVARLRTMAGERGLDVVRKSNGPRESGRGWRLVRLCDQSEIVIGGSLTAVGPRSMKLNSIWISSSRR